MCGIVGQIRFDGAPVDRALIERMNNDIAHRGPDGEGVHIDGPVGLGHRRLAIIDLESGAQPMGMPDGKVWVTYNGEIYNFKELRAELEAKGHTFQTSSDTEVLLYAWREWGAEMLGRLRGMFAFCLVDFAQRKWLLARDPFGIKPLCYRLNDACIEFGSEMHALKRSGDVCRLDAVEWFLRYQYIPAPFSIYRDIMKLMPAHFIQGDFDGVVNEPVRYWSLEFQALPDVGEDEWLARFDAALKDTVQAHLVSDVPVGVLLSGGVDSTLIACQAAGLSHDQIKAFTIDFDVEGFGELKWATQAADQCGLELHSDVVSDDFWSDLPGLVHHYGEPFGDNSCVPTWQLSKLARSHVPVVLAGDGGDEAFGGYKSYKRWLRKPNLDERMRRLRERPRGETLASLAWALAWRAGMPRNRRIEWERNMAYVPELKRAALWKRKYRGIIDQPCPAFVDGSRRARRGGLLDYAQQMDFQTYLPGAILTKSDVASMFHSLEIRTPFLDVEVLKLACSLPETMRARRNGKQITLKHLMRKSLRQSFDDEFVHRSKKGFGGPRERWFYEGRPGREFLREVVLDRASGLDEFFDRELIERWVNEHSPKRNHSSALWLLLVFGLWRQNNRGLSFDS